jgi:hypothetical protein
MPRDRQRLTLESGPKLDLAKLIPSGAGKPGSYIQWYSPMARVRPSPPF